MEQYSSHKINWLSSEWIRTSGFEYKGRSRLRKRNELCEGLSKRRSVVESLAGHALTRDFVRSQVKNAGLNPESLVDAFIAVMAWGFKPGGFGPYRTSVMLSPASGRPDPGDVLRTATQILLSDDDAASLVAYRHMARKLEQCGPAFATKFLYFASQDKSRAPIFDAVVASWMKRFDVRTSRKAPVSSTSWNEANYRFYLNFITHLQEFFGTDHQHIRHDSGVLEYIMFNDEKYLSGSNDVPDWIQRVPRTD